MRRASRDGTRKDNVTSRVRDRLSQVNLVRNWPCVKIHYLREHWLTFLTERSRNEQLGGNDLQRNPQVHK